MHSEVDTTKVETKKVDTKKVQNRRALRFESLDELRAEIDRVVAADKEGRVRTLGNWTPGQILGHIAAWMNYNYDGYPVKRPPWLIRGLIRSQKHKFLMVGMPAGVKIPRVENGTTGIELISTQEGAEKLRRAIDRMESPEEAKYDSPAFGPLTRDERIRLNLRHSELHLSFQQYEPH